VRDARSEADAREATATRRLAGPAADRETASDGLVTIHVRGAHGARLVVARALHVAAQDAADRDAEILAGSYAPPLEALFRPFAAAAAVSREAGEELLLHVARVPPAARHDALAIGDDQLWIGHGIATSGGDGPPDAVIAIDVAREAMGAIDVEVRGAPPELRLRLSLVRSAPTPEGSRIVARLAALDAELAIALGDGIPLDRTAIGPLPPGEPLAIALVDPASRRSEAVVVIPRGGERTKVVIDAKSAFGGELPDVGVVAGRVIHRGGEPVRRGGVVPIAESGAPLGATTPLDHSGGFVLHDVALDRPLLLDLVDFDAGDRDRVVRTRHEPAALARGFVEVVVATRRWLHATGVAPPPFLDVRQPIAFVLERETGDGRFVPIPCERFVLHGDPVAAAAAAIDGADLADPRAYRLVAVWSPLCATASFPAALAPGELEAVTTFRAPEPPGTREVVLESAGGSVVGNARIETGSAFAAAPPLRLLADADGRVVLGPLLLPADSEAADVELAITDPATGRQWFAPLSAVRDGRLVLR
jgi:hypothetical protein